MTTNDEPWTLDHNPHIWLQHEARPMPPDENGRRWTERRLTGYGTACCSCGYTTGLVQRDQLPDIRTFIGQHTPYNRPDLKGAPRP